VASLRLNVVRGLPLLANARAFWRGVADDQRVCPATGDRQDAVRPDLISDTQGEDIVKRLLDAQHAVTRRAAR
jgi:hypothetical protein